MISFSTSGVTSSGTSSSAKSNVATNNAPAFTSFALHSLVFSPSAPLKILAACLCCASVSASMRSAKPSTCAKSILPFSRAQRVNSPASADLKPLKLPNNLITEDTTALDPCR